MDDIAITAGSGTTVATDEIGLRHFQRVKLGIGGDGTAVDLQPAAIAQLASGTADAQAAAAATNRVILGFSVRESAATAAAAEVVIRHGTLATDPIIAVVQLAGDESVGEWWGPQGIACPNGIFVDRVAGTTEGSIFYL